MLAPFDPGRPELPAAVREEVEVAIKYEGYIKKQLDQVARMERLENTRLPEDTDTLYIHPRLDLTSNPMPFPRVSGRR